jgi:hypothetical protein
MAKAGFRRFAADLRLSMPAAAAEIVLGARLCAKARARALGRAVALACELGPRPARLRMFCA